MAPFVKGNKVKIKGTEYTGTVEDVYWSNQLIDVRPEITGTEWGPVVGFPAEWLELAKPHSWPPQAGDIWVANGLEFAVMAYEDQRIAVWPMDSLHTGATFAIYNETDTARFLALEPVLVRRRGAN